MRIFLVLISLSFLGLGCGDDSDGDKAASENNGTTNNAVTAFECLTLTCAAGDYCHYQKYGAGTQEAHSAECNPLPAGCADCDCVETDVRASYDGANNCDGLVSCSQSNAEITFVCTNPALGF